jgi:hypothetical protein
MPKVAIMPRPGIVRGPTPSASSGRWFDSNLVRWRGGVLQPVGGWAALPDGAGGELTSGEPPRDIVAWHSNDGSPWLAVGSTNKLMVHNLALRQSYNITPAGMPPLGEPGPFIGYGLGNFGESTYGTVRNTANIGPTDITSILGDIWSLDLWGELLVFCNTAQGSIYTWDPATPSTAPAAIAGAPTEIRGGIMVTDERHLVAVGADGDMRKVAWSDQEDFSSWVPTTSNLAGSLQLETEGRPMTCRRVTGNNLIWTDNDVHGLKYVGPPYAYGLSKLADNCGLLSRRAVSRSGALVQWIGIQTMWQYDGSVSPLVTDVSDWFFSMINRDQVGRVFGAPNASFSEHWFWFPSQASRECDRYIVLSYAEPGRPVAIGALPRTAGELRGALQRPILGAADGRIYLHEYGWTANGETRLGTVYAETGDYLLGEGDARYHTTQIEQDFIGPADRIGYRFALWEEPNGPQWDTGTIPITNDTGLTDARFSCRGMRMRIEQLTDGPWALGKTRLVQRKGGAR